jgi:hypothetical protein
MLFYIHKSFGGGIYSMFPFLFLYYKRWRRHLLSSHFPEHLGIGEGFYISIHVPLHLGVCEGFSVPIHVPLDLGFDIGFFVPLHVPLYIDVS